MSVDIQLYSKDSERWDAYLAQHEKASFFHLWAYQRVISKTFKHRPYYLVALQGEVIQGLLPLFALKSWLFGRFFVSLPFVDYGGICANDEATTYSLVQAAIRMARQQNIHSIELRHQHPNVLRLQSILNKINLVKPLHFDPEKVWKALNAKVRNQVRKAVNSGLTFESGGPDKLGDFYDVWSRNMRDLGTPAYPISFFQNFLNAFPGRTEVLLVRHGKKPVGAGIAVYFKNIMEIPWASSLREYFSKCPNNLLYWEAMKRACERGCWEFHFGRSSKNSGTYRFKKQWGAQDRQLYYQCWLSEGAKIPDINPQSRRYRFLAALWRRLPIAITNVLGPMIVRGIP